MITALICARGGSKGLPGKNTRSLAGKPLIEYAINTALECPEIDSVMVSTDDDNIAQIAEIAGAEVPFIRPAEISSDTAPEWLVWQHTLSFLTARGTSPDRLVVLPATAPLRRTVDVTSAIALSYEDGCDGVISVTDAHRNPCFNMVSMNDDHFVSLAMPLENNLHRRQDAPEFFDVTTVVYAMRPDYVRSASSLFEGNIKAIKVPLQSAVDIDTLQDFEFAEFLLSRTT